MKLILGSSSKYRKLILEREGYVFDVINPDVDEKAIKTPDIYERPLILARAKADAVVAKTKEPAIIIASDQVVICDGALYEKPVDEKETRAMIAHYDKGGVPECVTAVVVVNTITGEYFEGVDKARVFWKHIPEEAIKEFIAKDEPLTRAGGFGIRGTALSPHVEKIEGTEDSITGMPLHLLQELLQKAGYKSMLE